MKTVSADGFGRWISRPVAVFASAALLLSLAVSLQVVRERRYPLVSPDARTLYVPSAAVLERMALSFDSLVADVYWMRALQHYGATRRSDQLEKRYELLYPLLDMTTSLDPRFDVAYRFGAIFLAEAYPDGPGRPDLAVALLQKGACQAPERWEYLMDIGFVYYWWLRDYGEAARWFRRASEVPGSSWWLRSLAANTLAQGGNLEDSRSLWQQVYDSAEDEWRRRDAARRLMQLDALDEIDQLVTESERHAEVNGGWPNTWQELLGTGRPPLDPLDHLYVLDPSSREVRVSRQSPLWPLPAEPIRTPSP